ncbi:PhzF family phenazine biosynthesis protein [Paracoccus laeviglucosivorans]|uniref:Phenazine biosynthesis protein PhzF family n=1 Tax=Paracoccus laeviglucosivorans TaxID=1197861 RepID=A0A521CXX0_9RHOB|nr:PhzF family phenazine biosynthesis protein [Paracoccus laeviglucosivorans]SMO64264.1 phenazine biosynthesis protein PhzF family [Paracoccus laeviglucosivorans]
MTDQARRIYDFRQVDVFTRMPLRGNPLAVVHDATGLSDADMAAFANWTNLSETTFLLPPADPQADYRVRIFTPQGELPFAGHPTLGSCHAWLEAGGKPRGSDIVQECQVGLVRIRRAGDGLAFAAPPLLRSGPVEAALLEQLYAALGVTPDEVQGTEWIDNGPGWIGVLLKDHARLMSLRPDSPELAHLKVGICAPCAGGDAAFEVRAFYNPGAEDPVTGSLNAGLAQWLLGAGIATAPYVARQGTALGRDGRVQVTQDDDAIWIGGNVVTCITGSLDI